MQGKKDVMIVHVKKCSSWSQQDKKDYLVENQSDFKIIDDPNKIQVMPLQSSSTKSSTIRFPIEKMFPCLTLL